MRQSLPPTRLGPRARRSSGAASPTPKRRAPECTALAKARNRRPIWPHSGCRNASPRVRARARVGSINERHQSVTQNEPILTQRIRASAGAHLARAVAPAESRAARPPRPARLRPSAPGSRLRGACDTLRLVNEPTRTVSLSRSHTLFLILTYAISLAPGKAPEQQQELARFRHGDACAARRASRDLLIERCHSDKPAREWHEVRTGYF